MSFSFTEPKFSRAPASISHSLNSATLVYRSSKNMNTNVLGGPWQPPNATCPVCGQGVYFIQAENGGRVYFDELGPPWPKHFCTENSGIRNPAHAETNRWDRQGWQSLQNFTVTMADREDNFVVRVQGEDANRQEKRFFFRILDNVEFHIFRFLPGEGLTNISILALAKNEEFLIYEGIFVPGKFKDLKIKNSAEDGFAKEKFMDGHDSYEFFRKWESEYSWAPISNAAISPISGSLYKLEGFEKLEDISLCIRLDLRYSIQCARFKKIGLHNAIVSLLADDPGNKDNYLLIEGFASADKSFPPGKTLKIREVISKIQYDGASKKSISKATNDIKIEVLSKLNVIDVEIDELLGKISTLNQEKTQLLKKVLGQDSLLD